MALRCVASLLIVATVAGCAGNSSVPPSPFVLPTVSVTAPVRTVRSLTNSHRLGTFGGAAIESIAQLPDIETNMGRLSIVFWGTRDPSTRAIARITEAQVLGVGSPPTGVHIFFNDAMQPALLRDDSSGYAFTIVHETASRQRITVCDPTLAALYQTTVTDVNGTPQLGTVTTGGSCSVQLAGAAPAIAHPSAACPGDPASVAHQLCKIGAAITSGSFVAGLAFALTAIAKFNRHKDNPTQVPISQPIALLFIAAALIFIPSVFKSISQTIFGRNAVPVDGITPSYEPVPTPAAVRARPSRGRSPARLGAPFR